MNRKGSVFDIIIWIVLAFILLLVLGFLFYMILSVKSGLQSVGMIGTLNITNITDTVFEPATRNMGQGLNILAFIIIAGGAFSILLHNFLVRMHPAWMIAYILMTIMAIIIAAMVSNYYMDLLDSGILTTLEYFTMSNFILQWLPYWVAVVGILGTIFLFIGMIRDREISEGFY